MFADKILSKFGEGGQAQRVSTAAGSSRWLLSTPQDAAGIALGCSMGAVSSLAL